MARSSKQARKSGKPKSIFEQDRYTADLSTSQLVTGVCILLMFGLACFLLGVLIGRVDPTNAPREASLNPDVESPFIEERVQTTLRPADKELAANPAPELRVPKTVTQTESEPNASPTPTEEPNADETAQRRPQPVSITSPPQVAKVDAEKMTQSEELPPSEKSAQSATTLTKPAPKPETVAREEPIKVIKPQETTTPTPTPKQPLGPLPKELDTHYGIQIGVFSSLASAEKVKNTLESKSSYRVKLISPPGKNLFKVVVGDYADSQTAVRARDDLRKNYGYKDCFTIDLD